MSTDQTGLYHYKDTKRGTRKLASRRKKKEFLLHLESKCLNLYKVNTKPTTGVCISKDAENYLIKIKKRRKYALVEKKSIVCKLYMS